MVDQMSESARPQSVIAGSRVVAARLVYQLELAANRGSFSHHLASQVDVFYLAAHVNIFGQAGSDLLKHRYGPIGLPVSNEHLGFGNLLDYERTVCPVRILFECS